MFSDNYNLEANKSLDITNPELLNLWDFSKNIVKPSDITFGSEKKVYWICNNNHSYVQKVCYAVNGSRCPYCSGQKVLKGFNDFESKFPNLAKEWNYKKNGDLKPSNFTFGSGKKVWWICSKGHEYETTITNKTKPTRPTNCPYCSNRKVLKGYNDLATTNPALALEWDYANNIDTPNDVTVFSNKFVNWICKNGHTWKQTVANRSSGRNCPYCSNKKVLKGYNDLVTTHSNLAKEWNYKKNGDLKPSNFTFGSGKKVWWICSKGHEWQAIIDNRAGKDSGCPQCMNEFKTSFPELCVYFYIKKLFNDALNRYTFKLNNKNVEVDVWIPALKLAIEIDGYRFHLDKETKDNNKSIILYKENITLIRVREIWNENYLPTLDKKYNTIISSEFKTNNDLANIVNCVIKKINIMFNKDIHQIISSSDILRDEIKIRSLIDYYVKEKSLSFVYPAIAKQWHYQKNGNLKPENVCYSSLKVVWWICSKGHEYKASLHSRTKGTVISCPYCSGQKVLKGFNDFESKFPNLAKEWNYKKNGDLKPSNFTSGTTKKVWWICSKGHEYEQSIGHKSKGSQCPYCCGQKVLKGFNDLATINPVLASEFHPNLNGELTIYSVSAGSKKKVWWICSKGHEWEQIINNRHNRGSRCPYCRKNK